jgi:hypothetical protein
MASAPIIQSSDVPPTPAGLSETAALKLESEVIEFTEKLYTTATGDNAWEKEVRETTRLLDYLEGRQWSDSARRARHRPCLNKVARHFWDSVGLLTDLSLDFSVKLFNRLSDFSDFEKMLNDLCVHWAMNNKFEDRQYDIILYGMLGTGPAKIQWNPALAGGMGDVELLPIASWQWATLGGGTNPQDAECVQYFPVVTKDYLVRKFGKTALRVQCDLEYSPGSLQGNFKRPPNISKDSWSRMGNALRTSLGIKSNPQADDTPYPMTMQKEFWLRDNSVNESSTTVTVGPCDPKGEPTVNWAYRVEPGEALYPRGRVIVQAGGCVLEDQPNPYWDAQFPFPVFRPFRLPWKSSGHPQMRSWTQMNNMINRILGGMQDYLHSVIEPTLIGPKGAMPQADWDALDPGAAGGKIKYNNNAPKGPEFMKKAEFPLAAAFQYLGEISKEFDMTSGSSAMQQALGKKQVPGGDSLDMILSARSLPIRVESRSLASFIEEGGGMVISRMLQFYSVAHRINILGAKGISSSDYTPLYGQALPSGMKGEDFVKRFSGVVRRDTLLASQKEQKQQVAIGLYKLGALSQRNLFRILDAGVDYDQNVKELLEEARIKILVAGAAAAAQGKGQGKKK